MNKIKRYIILLKYVHRKRYAMCAAKEKITSYQKEYFLDEPELCSKDSCITKFERVYGICLDPNAYDEHGDFTRYCLFLVQNRVQTEHVHCTTQF